MLQLEGLQQILVAPLGMQLSFGNIFLIQARARG